MRLAALGLTGGAWLLQHRPELPQTATLAWLAGGIALLGLIRLTGRLRPPRGPGLRLVAAATTVLLAVALGFGWSAWRATQRMADALDPALQGEEIVVTGRIAGLGQPAAYGYRFRFDVDAAPPGVPGSLWLGWYRGGKGDDGLPRLHAGERWQLAVRLRRPHGLANPHGFDYEAWLLERNLRATGSVRRGEANQRLEAFAVHPDSVISRARERVRERFAATLPEAPYTGVLVALAVGDQRAIAPDRWNTFTRTGINHLFSVSGLHITLLGGLAAWGIAVVWRRVPALVLRLPARKAAAVGGLAVAVGYALLAGMEIPAQRTVLMLAVVALAHFAALRAAPSRLLAWALVLVVLADPWAVLAAGFWLSFGAVAFLLYAGSGDLVRRHGLWLWVRSQWAVTVGLVPLLLLLFQQFPLVSPLANAVAIPVVSFVVTPLALLAAAVPMPALLWLAHAVLAALMTVLDALAALPWSVWQQPVPPAWATAAAVAGCLWLLAPRGLPLRACGLALMLPALTVQAPRPASGAALVRVMDVGQGLAVHVQTAAHDLMFDAGPRYGPEADAGSRVLTPYLRAAGVRRLDALILSHDDSDHVGGAASLAGGVAIDRLITGGGAQGERFITAVTASNPCVAGDGWTWDGVRFEILGPPSAYTAVSASPPRHDNNASCVLRVSAGDAAVLLAADIEAPAEAALVTRYGAELATPVLLLGHHGSRSSSSTAFLDAVQPAHALIAVGHASRFGHPHTEVLARLRERGIRWSRTDRDGAVTLRMGPRAGGVDIEHQRALRRRYWHDG